MCTDASRLAQKKYNASPQGKETRRKQKEKKKQERYLPEEISSTVDGYEINGNVVTLRSGKVEVREGSAKQLDKGAIAFLKKQKISIDNKVMVGKAIMPESVYKTAVEQGKQQTQNFKANMDKNVKGYSEITEAIEKRRKYDDQLKQDINKGVSVFRSDDGIPTSQDVEKLKKKYPRAAAYMYAEGYANASHHAKAMAGERAKTKIRRGESYKKAIQDMEQEWKKSLNYNS